MKMILHFMIAGALIFSAGTAMAAKDQSNATSHGFHALSNISEKGELPLNALGDDQLDTITGGYTPHPDGPIIVRWPFPFPWPGPICLSCPGPYLDRIQDRVINPATFNKVLYR